jgi:rhodanese-related sulfurtransferase
MKNLKLIVLSLFFASLFFVSCEKDDDDDDLIEVNPTEVLAKYLDQQNFISSNAQKMIKASDLNAEILAGNDVKIIDVRAEDDYNSGHIEGAVHVNGSDALSYVEEAGITKDDKIVFVCYTGQGAGYFSSLFRALGYDSYDLKWGMSSWHTDFAGPWNDNIQNTYATQLETDAYDKNAEGELPEITVTATDGAEILYERAQDVVKGWGDTQILASELFANIDNYYIANYWPDALYNLGHIPGAIQYAPTDAFTLAEDLKTLPTDKPIVVYCHTGQTSAHVAAYLRLLGYEAKSLMFGVNRMAYDDFVTNESFVSWKAEYSKDYDYVTE